MKKVLVVLGLVMCVGLLTIKAPVQAETSPTTVGTTNPTDSPTTQVKTSREDQLKLRTQELQTKTANLQNAREKEATRAAQRCEQIGQKIDTALSNYQNNRTSQINLYQAMAEKIQQILLKLQQNGIDVSTLQSDLQLFNVKIQQLNTDASAAMAQLQVAKQYECGNSQGQFMTQLGKARTLMQTVEKDAQDVRQFFQSKIRPDIETLRSQIKTTELGKVKGSPNPNSELHTTLQLNTKEHASPTPTTANP